MKENTIKVADLVPDDKNANQGTVRGRQMLRESLREYGAGRSALVDKDNRIIAGNKTLEQAAVLGMEDCIIVDSDGTKPVVVRRTDLSLNDPKARELAIADNRVGEVGLDWNHEVMNELVDTGSLVLEKFWTPEELADLNPEPKELEEKVIELKPQTFIRVLISVPVETGILAQEHLDALGKIAGIEVEYGAN